MSLKTLFFGKSRSLSDQDLFHKVSLIALFAWVGLGADGLSSSCYGPEETFKALGGNTHLALFVALASVVTIIAICASYSQIISLFPTGGGGYLVATKLLSPFAGVVSGSALLIDYVLTITISVASGADALFSILPQEYLPWKLVFSLAGVGGLTLINLRGVKESVMLWVPVFFLFVGTHAFAIIYALSTHASGLGQVASATAGEVHLVSASVGWFGLMALLLKAYSMGAGTYTGIEAVSNGLPILREPRVQTGRRTMIYMGVSLAVTVAGLLLAYLLYAVKPTEGKTLNAVLFEAMTGGWGHRSGWWFVKVTLASEAALLLIAAQTGFLDGPRVLANMALDRWFPTRFANLSDRFVTQNGLVLMGAAAFVMMAFTKGSVDLLVVLYSINVFITFSLSQLGMVVHWWQERAVEPGWQRKLAINGFGFALTFFILISLTLEKFTEGGWVTIVITGLLIAAAYAVRRHYLNVGLHLRRLDAIVEAADLHVPEIRVLAAPPNPKARTAVILVNGYNGLGLHTLLHVPRMFGDTFRNYAFVQVGAVDAGNFKGAADIEALRHHTAAEAARYVKWAKARGYGSESYTTIGHDLVGEVLALARQAAEAYPNHVFFAGQLLFTRETRLTRWLHNHTVFTLQRRFFLANMPFVILPIRVDED
ncbi:APC family permease [Opitutus sp. GAS368]|jgi:amino acid transporter|uniref:APC family permease n=1 Tax=Opitutus sp. GAS368 TaxID=1882749 RepID=UPI000879C696|nr:APC family permease [Opitutus sp. GAS368]SDR68394.1 amino acid/polyamine/organocation transporter, APC superfamily [Opitutus sp. GAS368]